MKAFVIGLVFFPVIAAGNLFAQSAAGRFTVKGTISGTHADSALISYRTPEKFVRETVPVINNAFVYSGTVNEPASASILFKTTGEVMPKGTPADRVKSFFIEQGLITISGDPANMKDLKITGSKTQNEMDELAAKTAALNKEKEPFVAAYTAEKDHEKAAAIRDQWAPIDDKIKKITYRFFLDHPNSYVTSNQIKFYVSSVSLDSLKKVYADFSPAMKSNANGVELAAEIRKIESGLPGKMAYVFAKTDINGAPLSLADYKGKYVLLDFWASWCVPCRKGNPHLLALYAKYKAKGFEVIGISDDDSKPDAWKQAVADDHIGVWKHVLRGLKRTATGYDRSSDINEGYGIHTLPTKILVDPTGKIIGRYGDSIGKPEEELDKLLVTLLGK